MTKRLLASLMLIGLISLTGCAKTEEAPLIDGEANTTDESMEENTDAPAMEEEKTDEAMEEDSMEDKAEDEAMEDKTDEAAA